MGNSQLVRILSDIGVTDISARDVFFQEGLLQATATFQRHNYQLYQVHCPDPKNPLGFQTNFHLILRVIRCLNDDKSIQILKKMQETVVELPQHPNLIRFYIMAIVNEDHNENQKAGLIGMYRSADGATDYKNDTLQFILVEEDHLQPLPANFFPEHLNPPEFELNQLKSRLTLKQFMDRVLPNPLLIEFFSSDECIMYQLIIQSLQALAFLNENQQRHGDLAPQNIIIELMAPEDPASTDFSKKFRIKLGEYLGIKTLSDIAYQRSLLLKTEAQVNEMNAAQGNKGYDSMETFIQCLKSNKAIYSQYDPPEKVRQETLDVKLRADAAAGCKLPNQHSYRDFNIEYKPAVPQHDSFDIWSLGVILLEIYLSLYVHKRDCKEMVHNLYLNKLSYQSRCVLLNQVLDNKRNPIICSLIKEMLRDSAGQPEDKESSPSEPSRRIIDEQTMYDELIGSKQETDRPTASQLLTKSRIIHYLAYISDNQIEHKYLPGDINLLQVFVTNEMFVPMLIRCGMQNILNRKKSIICFFSLMTLYIKSGKQFRDAEESLYMGRDANRLEDKSRVQKLILDALMDSKAHLQMIELLTYCLSSDLRQVLIFFDQNLDNEDAVEHLKMDGSMFKVDFLEQKAAGLECLLAMMRRPDVNLQKFVQEAMSCGLTGLIILLTQRIKNQEWMRCKNFAEFVTLGETNQPLTQLTLEFIEKLVGLSLQGYSRTVCTILDKSGFFTCMIESLFKKQTIINEPTSARDRLLKRESSAVRTPVQKIDLTGLPGTRLSNDGHPPLSQRGPTNQAQGPSSIRLNSFKKVFRDRLIDFLQHCVICMSEPTLKKLINSMLDNDFGRLLLLLKSQEMQRRLMLGFSTQVGESTSFKSWLLQILMKKFTTIYLAQQSGKREKKQSLSRDIGNKSQSRDRNCEERGQSKPALINQNRKSMDKDETATMNMTQTSIKSGGKAASQHRQKSVRNNGASSARSMAAGPMTDQERQLCELSRIITSLVDSKQSQKVTHAIQECIRTQTCLSSEKFHQLAGLDNSPRKKVMLEQSVLDERRPQTGLSPRKAQYADNYTNLQRTQVKNAENGSRQFERRSSTQQETVAVQALGADTSRKPDSSIMDQTEITINKSFIRNNFLKPIVPQMVGLQTRNLFFDCETCENKTYCLVCAVKFHQDHKITCSAKPVENDDCGEIESRVCHSEVIEQYLQSTEANYTKAEIETLRGQLNFDDCSLLWTYEIDQYLRAEKPQSANPLRDTQSTKSLKNKSKRPQIPMANNNIQFKKFASKAVLNFDIFDKGAIKQESETHFINVDQSDTVHSLLSSAPLEPVVMDESRFRSLSPKSLFDSQKQSYIELAIHSAGFSDQVQIGVLFMHDRDVLNGLATSSDLSNSVNNLNMIPGYEPLSIGYHGDDGKIYGNLSQDLCIDHLIKKAQKDPEALLDEAETADSSLFDINTSQVYGGLYGPTYSSGDHIGVGLVPISTSSMQTQHQEYAVYFTVNGLFLPAVKLSSNSLRVYPVLSVKGRLCHIEVLQDTERYRFNQNNLDEHKDKQLQNQLVGSEKFMRCLTQFDHILNLKSRRMSYSTTLAARNADISDADIADQTERLSKREHSVSHAAVSEKTQNAETQPYGKRLAAQKLLQLLKPQRATRNYHRSDLRKVASESQMSKPSKLARNFGSQGRMHASREMQHEARNDRAQQKTARLTTEKRGMPINFVQRNILKVSKSQQKL